MSSRLAKIREALAANDLDAIVITQPENRRYISGFTGSSALLLISMEHALLATDFRYYEQVEKQSPDFRLIKVETNEIGPILNNLVQETQTTRVGFECQHVTVDTHKQWADAAEGFDLVPSKDIVETIRATKDQNELATIRRGILHAHSRRGPASLSHHCRCGSKRSHASCCPFGSCHPGG